MFGKFFAAITRLTASANVFADSIDEANDRFRANLGLDVPADAPALPPASADPIEEVPTLPSANGKHRKATSRVS